MNYYEEEYPEKISYDKYDELQTEFNQMEVKFHDKDFKLQELVVTIFELGNKYDFAEAYAKLIEYMKEMKLDEYFPKNHK